MATIADNIRSMAELVASVKKQYHLQEGTILRIIDMNFALAQNAGTSTFSGDEDFPMPGEPPEGVEQLTMFPESDEETAEMLGIVQNKEEENGD